MYRNYPTDPVLLKLESATVSALQSAGILCLEDLLRIELNEIGNLHGIGKKRDYEIQRLLHSLPFSYNKKPVPINPEKDGLLGVNGHLSDYLAELLTYQVDDHTVKRGLTYFRETRVKSIRLADEGRNEYEVHVKGSRQYKVTLPLTEKLHEKQHCTCPAFTQWMYSTSFCKHIVAAMLAVAEHQRLSQFTSSGDGDPAYRQLMLALKQTQNNPLSRTKSEELEYMLVNQTGDWILYPKRIYPQLKSLNKKTSYSYSYKNPWNFIKPVNARDELIINLLMQQADFHLPYYYGSRNEQSLDSTGEILELMRERNLYVKIGQQPAKLTPFRSEPFSLFFHISRNSEKETSTLKIECKLENDGTIYSSDEVQIVDTNPVWVLSEGIIGKLETSDFAMQVFYSTQENHIDVPESELNSFLSELYPLMAQAGMTIKFSDNLKTPGSKIKPEPRLYLHENGRALITDLKMAYNEFEIDGTYAGDELLTPVSKSGENVTDNGKEAPLLQSITRDWETEESALQALEDHGLVQNGTSWRFIPNEDPLEWAVEQLPKLADAGIEIFGQKELTRFAPPKKMTSSSIRVSSKEQWFELEGSLSFGDIELSLQDIEQVLLKKNTFVKLNDGSLGELSEGWIKQLKRLRKLSGNGRTGEDAKVPRIAATVLEEIGLEADNFEIDTGFEEYAKRLHTFEKIDEITPPDDFRGELRSYQQAGLSWMKFLNTYAFGGILADDMGLGKTIQVLALLKSVQQEIEGELRSLVIAPRSVLHNWAAEASKFVPDFNVHIHHGTDRTEHADQLPDCEIVITTYATMRNDIDLLSKKEFDYAILDESHAIRNPESKTFRALRKIRAKNRLCMTGTPVQNTTMDLWSQFEFLNPGFLGNKKSFRNNWVKPVEKEEDTVAEELLHKMVSPFILRRTKKQVATDLPPLTSSLVDCPMEQDQQTLYEKYRKTYYELVNESLEAKGVQKSRFTVLEGLLRLRQICCSPSLIDGEKAASAKLLRFTELASELISGGHRALVFSQFVGFLKQIEEEVQKAGWSYEYLDGQTTDRQERVNRFQEDESKKLFLISLKAGGEGLNLTGADYVFIMDPWWNPAAERQAMDRTHRIGQKENVFVYRFLTPGTVEEKILRLQDRKRSLAEKLVVAESGIFKELEKKDLISLFE